MMNLGALEKPLRLIRGLGPAKTGSFVSMPGAMMPRAQPDRPMPERRAAPRVRLVRNVLIRRRGEIPTPGTLIDLSETGAAVRIEPHTDIFEGVWPFKLANGDDIWLTALLEDPVECWVVAVYRDVLRIRFARDDGLRIRLRALARTSTAA